MTAVKVLKYLPAIIRILRAEAKRWTTPIVGTFVGEDHAPFKILISTVLSLRTKDKTTAEASHRLFRLAETPKKMATLSIPTIEKAIYPVGFYHTKARNILKICGTLFSRFSGRVPDDLETLLTLDGVGRKTANLVVTLGYKKLGICVDTHVHRISNRWGLVKTKTPNETEMVLRKILPKRYWIIFNDLLVVYGQNLCVPISPFCSRCKINRFCAKARVTTSR
ncbi:MAG: endonuclease III [Candidatus Omnitrophica bacterium CG07_land_8_20_14_0_80_50_8]|nr:MAG: endonuclease III [Candidatus Omnitrophica bacterium CG07_land_8_20_14_0_80_50_8]